ncbi:ferredoxin [Janibacter sp. GXQ6167]|uniref:ferredoxin n=1 Tax=Janibacter sp. GXQ6167 TaxID=3240791 RepID=UPI00352350CC
MAHHPTRRSLTLTIDPTRCTGHGVCAHLLPDQVTLDEWGYPILHRRSAEALGPEGQAAIRLCPARALTWT